MDKKEYAEYLKTEHWQEVREVALQRADQHCSVCGATEDIHVHHNTYDRIGDERPSDLAVLCNDCHSLFHHASGKGFPNEHYEAMRGYIDSILYELCTDYAALEKLSVKGDAFREKATANLFTARSALRSHANDLIITAMVYPSIAIVETERELKEEAAALHSSETREGVE